MFGFESDIIRGCSFAIRGKFFAVRFLMVLIFLTILASSGYTFYWLFDSWLNRIILTIIFTLIISNSMLFLLHLFFKNVLPVPRPNGNHLSFALFTKFAFLTFLALIFSKPIEHFLFTGWMADSFNLQATVQEYRSSQIVENTVFIQNFFGEQIEHKRELIRQQSLVSADPQDTIVQNYIKGIEMLEAQQKAAIARITTLIKESPYFLQGIILLNERNGNTWWITIVMVIFFWSPFLIIHSISLQSDYCLAKQNRETTIIETHYRLFKIRYTELIQKEFPEKYLDPPYNTRQVTFDFQPEKDFIQEIYG